MSDTTLFRIDPSRNPILANLPADAATTLIAKGVRKSHRAGEILVREGEVSDFLMFVVAGEVAILKEEMEIDRQPAGGVLGEMGVLTGQKRTATVKCVTDVVLWEVRAEDFLEMLDGYPKALRSLIRTLVEKFEATHGVRVKQATGLQQATDILSRCLSPEVMDTVLKHRTPDELLGGSLEEAAILFLDIRGFTTAAETMPARQLLAALNEHLEIFVASISKHNGTIVNFIGDAVLAVFNTPVPIERPCVAAVNCYLHCVYEMREMQARRRLKEAICFEIGAGINYGSVVAGAIGSKQRFSYSVLGDEVNLAARLESLTRRYPTDVIISESAFKRLSNELSDRCVQFDRVQVKGRKAPVNLYTLTEMNPAERAAFAQAMNQYLGGKFATAAATFAAQPHRLAEFMANRCRQLAATAPDWDGCWVWDSK